MLPFEESESWDYTYVLDAGVRSWKPSAENSGVDNSEGPYCASKAQLVDQGLPESESLLMVLTYGLLNLLQGGICTSNVSMKNWGFLVVDAYYLLQSTSPEHFVIAFCFILKHGVSLSRQ